MSAVAEIVQEIERLRLVAIIRADSAAAAVETGELLIAAGLPIVEVALTTPSAAEAIAELARGTDGRVVGAGTVLSVDDAREVAAAGARFVVSPGLDEEVVREAGRLGLVAMPGAATATEVARARRAGADFVKLFPASTYGAAHLRALRVVYADVRFVPTGGVDATNASAWFAAGATAIGIGSALTSGGAEETRRQVQELLAAASR